MAFSLCPQGAHCREVKLQQQLSKSSNILCVVSTNPSPPPPSLLKGIWYQVFLCAASNFLELPGVEQGEKQTCKKLEAQLQCCEKCLMYKTIRTLISFFFRLLWCYQYSLDYSMCQRSCFHFYFWYVEVFTVFKQFEYNVHKGHILINL